jgi:hypothetical protein
MGMMVENYITFPLVYFASAIIKRTMPKIAVVVPLSGGLLAMFHGPKFFVNKKGEESGACCARIIGNYIE